VQVKLHKLDYSWHFIVAFLLKNITEIYIEGKWDNYSCCCTIGIRKMKVEAIILLNPKRYNFQFY